MQKRKLNIDLNFKTRLKEMNCIPSDIRALIYGHLDIFDIKALKCVSKYFYRDNALEKRKSVFPRSCGSIYKSSKYENLTYKQAKRESEILNVNCYWYVFIKREMLRRNICVPSDKVDGYIIKDCYNETMGIRFGQLFDNDEKNFLLDSSDLILFHYPK